MSIDVHIVGLRQVEERHVVNKIDLMVWSNKMDLLALSNIKGEVALHRLNWQMVWMLAPPSPDVRVRKIAWRPDGRVIAIAYVPRAMIVGEEVNGDVMLVDVENNDILHVIKVKDDVSCLLWLHEKHLQDVNQNLAATFDNQDGISDFLPKLPPLPRTFDSTRGSIDENNEDGKRIKGQRSLNFLLVGTCDGSLYLGVFGLFSCGIMNINKNMAASDKEKHISILNAEITSDMKSLFLLVAIDQEKCYKEFTNDDIELAKEEFNRPQYIENGELTMFSASQCSGEYFLKKNCVSKINMKREIKLLVLDTGVLSSRSRELHAFSIKYGVIISLLEYLSHTMRSIVETWENICLLEMESKLSKYVECLPEGSLSADFLELLLIGVPSDSLEHFLLNELSDESIKQLGNSIELSHSNIQKLILIHILSVGQNLAYHLAELKGMAKVTDRFKVLGLEEETVAKAFSAAGSFLIKSTEVQLVIEKSKKRYKAFFRWLNATILRITDGGIPDFTTSDINQQDLEMIADHLYELNIKTDADGVTKRHCYLDSLGEYLVDQNLTRPNETDNDNHWQTLLEQNPCLQNNTIKRCKHTSLVQEYEHLTNTVKNVFKTPEYAIGNMFKVEKIVNITNVACKEINMCLLDDHKILLSLIVQSSPDSIQLIAIPTNGITTEIKSKTVYFHSEKSDVMRCLDVQFYLPDMLSVLLQEKHENRNTVIVQAATKAICENSSDTINGNTLIDENKMRQVSSFAISSFAVCGSRKVAAVLSENKMKVRLFEIEGSDEEDGNINQDKNDSFMSNHSESTALCEIRYHHDISI